MEGFTGMVVRIAGPHVTVRDVDGREWPCVLRGRLRKTLVGATSPVAIGDRVEVRSNPSGDGVVQEVLPRASRLARLAAGQPPREQVLAANLDLAVVVVAAPPRMTVIDRYLALVQAGGSRPLVCVNKIDLTGRADVDSVMAPYRAAVPVVLTSAVTGEGVDELRAQISGALAAFVGPSGGGKSSLINALDPTQKVRIGALAATGKGRHTTTWAATYTVGDALIVDTPGLRTIGFLENEGREAALDLFPEITALAAKCRFRNCTHTHEPRCEVKAAVESGDIDADMYRRYARLSRRRQV